MVDVTSLADLKPDARNARKHNPRNIGMIASSLQEVGAARSIVIDEDNNILAGNGTIEAAAQVGIERVRVVEADGNEIIAVRRSGLSKRAKKRLALFDNRTAELAEWEPTVLEEDKDILDGLFSKQELDELLSSITEEPKEDPGAQVDRAAELQEKWQTERGQLWQIGRHRLLCGDSTSADDVARLMDGARADCVFTSPPYAVGIAYGTYQDTIENLREMLPKLSARWLEVVCLGGFAVINFGDIASGRDIANSAESCEYPMALEYWPVFRANGWSLWSRRIWCKPNPRVHSLQCIGSNRAATDWEHLWTWKCPGDPIIKRVDGEYRSASGWIDTSRMQGVDVGKETHGAGMAAGIAVWMLTVHSRPDGVVHEPFCGTGTTMVAAEQTGRTCYAMEIEPKYVAVALERMAGMGLEPVRIDGR